MNKILLIIAGLLILIGLTKPNFSSIVHNNKPNISLSLEEPSDNNIRQECEDVSAILKKGSSEDAIKLRDLFLDISRLIELDGEDLVIKNTEDIRQANSLAGPMLKLDIRGKYPGLAAESKQIITAVIGDDNIPLTSELRKQASNAFKYLAWACNEGAK